MSTRRRRRKCCSCHQLYEPDARSRSRQNYCSQPQCRKASKAASQRRWRESDKGRDYFRGPANRQRVKDWRVVNPGRAKGGRKSSRALQEDSPPQAVVETEVKPLLSHGALQEMIDRQDLILTGFIAIYVGSTDGALQEIIDSTRDRLLRLGQQVRGPALSFSKGSGGMSHGGIQASALQGSAAASPPAVQLGGPSPDP